MSEYGPQQPARVLTYPSAVKKHDERDGKFVKRRELAGETEDPINPSIFIR